MGFWVFMLIMVWLIPVTMISCGRYFLKRPPKEINTVYGYRTKMSMKNRETWEFAHKCCGKIWYMCGMVLAPLSTVIMLFAIGKNKDSIGIFGGSLCAVQLVFFVGATFLTEMMLKRNFDENGNGLEL